METLSAPALWAILGFILVIIELVTGTLYLLMIGVAALVAAGMGYLGFGFWAQTVTAAVVALLGSYAVHLWWKKHALKSNITESLDVGQQVVLETWVNEAAGLARVKYRGTWWDAKVTGLAKPNDTLTIHGEHNGVLDVRTQV